MSEPGRHSEVGVLLGEAVQGPLTYSTEMAPVQCLEAAPLSLQVCVCGLHTGPDVP